MDPKTVASLRKEFDAALDELVLADSEFIDADAAESMARSIRTTALNRRNTAIKLVEEKRAALDAVLMKGVR